MNGTSFQSAYPRSNRLGQMRKRYSFLPGGGAFQAQWPNMLAANRTLTGPYPGVQTRSLEEVLGSQGGMTNFWPSGVAGGTSIQPSRAGLPNLSFANRRWPAYQQGLDEQALDEQRREMTAAFLRESGGQPRLFDRQGTQQQFLDDYLHGGLGVHLSGGFRENEVDPRVAQEFARRSTLRRYAQQMRAATEARNPELDPGTYVSTLSPGEPPRLPSTRAMLRTQADVAREGGHPRLADYLEQHRAERLKGPRSRLAGLAAFQRQQREEEMGGPMTPDIWMAMQHPEIATAQAAARATMFGARTTAETEREKLKLAQDELEREYSPMGLFMKGMLAAKGEQAGLTPEMFKALLEGWNQLQETLRPLSEEEKKSLAAGKAARQRRMEEGFFRGPLGLPRVAPFFP